MDNYKITVELEMSLKNNNSKSAKISIHDSIFDLCYTKELVFEEYLNNVEIFENLHNIKIVNNGNSLLVENGGNNIKVNVKKNNDGKMTANYELYKIINNRVLISLFGTKLFENMHTFCNDHYSASSLSIDKLEKIIDFSDSVPFYKKIDKKIENCVDYGSKKFVNFMNVFLTYFSYLYSAKILHVNIIHENTMCYLKLLFILYDMGLYNCFTMDVCECKVIYCVPMGLKINKKNMENVYHMTIHIDGRFVYVFFSSYKSKMVIDNYF